MEARICVECERLITDRVSCYLMCKCDYHVSCADQLYDSVKGGYWCRKDGRFSRKTFQVVIDDASIFDLDTAPANQRAPQRMYASEELTHSERTIFHAAAPISTEVQCPVCMCRNPRQSDSCRNCNSRLSQ